MQYILMKLAYGPIRRKTAVTIFMNCCNKGFTRNGRKAAIIKQQLKNKSKGFVARSILQRPNAGFSVNLELAYLTNLLI